MTMERRSIVAEVRSDGNTITGYGAVFNVETVIGSYFREKIAPGAFSGSLGADVRSYFNHDSNNILGRTKSGTLRIAQDDTGLSYDVDLPDTQIARDLRVSMDRGDVDGSSFAFNVIRETWDDETGKLPLRTIHEAELFEVGPVTTPAYPDAKVALRSLEAAKEEREKAEHNAAQAKARISARKAESEQRFRGIKPE